MTDGSALPVTIIVPVYDHWSSLERCVESIIRTVDTTVHKVILVNDVGPHADTIEALLLEVIRDRPGFEYFRNETNIGFVGTCNRAVYELDRTSNDILLLNSDAELTPGALEELSAVLHLAEHHAVVCPRSNNATIATLPFFRRGGYEHAEVTRERTAELASAVGPLLPRYYLAPVAIGFCFLVRRSVIENHGLFDVAFGRGYNEENDFCLRINALGYSSLIANHALAWHLGSASFGETKSDLERVNNELLVSRYPFYPASVSAFIESGYSVFDVFAEAIAPNGSGPRSVLIDIHHLSLVHNGSTRFALSFIQSISKAKIPRGIEITIAAQSEAIEFFDLGQFGFRVVPYWALEGVYDIGVAVAPVNHLDQLLHLNRHCARWIVTHFDMIASRSLALLSTDPLRSFVVEKGLRFADRVVAISDFSLADAAAYYPQLRAELAEHAEAVLLGSTREMSGVDVGDRAFDRELPEGLSEMVTAGGYVVLMGNFYPHKQVAKALEALERVELPIIVFGPIRTTAPSPSTIVIAGGTLSEGQLQQIFEHSALVVFPSAYEGFGLPIADAVDFGVPVVAFDTSVAREVARRLRIGSAVRFFSRFADLASLVTDALADSEFRQAAATFHGKVRDLTPFNRGLWRSVLRELDAPIDLQALELRYREITALGQVAATARAEVAVERARAEEVLSSRTYRTGRQVARLGSPLLRAVRRIRRS